MIWLVFFFVLLHEGINFQTFLLRWCVIFFPLLCGCRQSVRGQQTGNSRKQDPRAQHIHEGEIDVDHKFFSPWTFSLHLTVPRISIGTCVWGPSRNRCIYSEIKWHRNCTRVDGVRLMMRLLMVTGRTRANSRGFYRNVCVDLWHINPVKFISI